MITQSGIRVAPDTNTVPAPLDLAVHMARITRFGGAVWSPLLLHSVLVAELVWRELATRKEDFDFPSFCWALLHDAHETVTGEIPRPWKPKQMKDYQHELDYRIAQAYRVDLTKVDLKLVKAMDERALLLEANSLGLPKESFQKAYSEREMGGDGFPAVPDDQLRLGEDVATSAFWNIDVRWPFTSRIVRTLAQIFTMIKSGDQVGAANAFRLMFDRVVVDKIRE